MRARVIFSEVASLSDDRTGPLSRHLSSAKKQLKKRGIRIFGPGLVKFLFSKKVAKIDEIFTVDLTVSAYCQIGGEDFLNFCGLLKKHEL